MTDRSEKKRKQIICVLVVILFAFCFTLISHLTGALLSGSHLYGHLFKAKVLYEQIKAGNPYPIYNENWYSGMELFRYWPPAAYYFYAIIMLITGGDIEISQMIFSFIVHAVAGCGFVLFAKREDRYVLCTAIGVLYMILPENLRVFFSEGSIPLVFVSMLLPYFFYYICEFIFYREREAIIGVDVIAMLIASAHIMSAAMTMVAVFVFLFVYCVANKKLMNALVLLVNIGLAYMAAGILLVPYFMGGLINHNQKASQYTFETVWSRYAAMSLNPFLLPAGPDDFYFGLSVFVLLIFAVMVWRKHTIPFFATALMIFAGTTMIMMPLISAIPFSQVFWMIRYIPIAYTLILTGILYWKEIKRKALIFFLVFISLDSVFAFVIHVLPGSSLFPSPEEVTADYMLDKAMKVTESRLACLDLTNMGSYPAYMLTKDGNNTWSLFGWDYPGAYTINEIVELNEAFETGYYDYVFDRLIRYGCDTVVVKKDEIKTDYAGFVKKAQDFGYDLMDETEKGLLFDFRTRGKYGTIYNYPNACIGVGSEYMSYLYPSFFKLRSNKLDDYTFDYLKQYKKIYITGPEYKDKEYCEKMIRELSDAGVQIYIDMNRLPIDKSTGRNSLLGVVAQPIVFNDEFPILTMDNGTEFKLVVDKEHFKEWRTVYFTNLKNVTKTARYSNTKHLPYLGTSPNKNITFIGLNLVYFQGCGVNQESQLYRFLDEVFDVDRSYLPEREMVPIDIGVQGNEVTVHSERDGVMTGLSNLESFKKSRNTGDGTFVMADKGITTLKATYAYFPEGMICTVFGLILTIVSIWYIIRRYNIGGITFSSVMATYFSGSQSTYTGPAPGAGSGPEVKNEETDADNNNEGAVSYIADSYIHLMDEENSTAAQDTSSAIDAEGADVVGVDKADDFDTDVGDAEDFDH